MRHPAANVIAERMDQYEPRISHCLFRCGPLPHLPTHFQERMQETMRLSAFTVAELQRRKMAFMTMWQELRPVVEQAVQLSYDEIIQLV